MLATTSHTMQDKLFKAPYLVSIPSLTVSMSTARRFQYFARSFFALCCVEGSVPTLTQRTLFYQAFASVRSTISLTCTLLVCTASTVSSSPDNHTESHVVKFTISNDTSASISIALALNGQQGVHIGSLHELCSFNGHQHPSGRCCASNATL
jgi:hypothetical protein